MKATEIGLDLDGTILHRKYQDVNTIYDRCLEDATNVICSENTDFVLLECIIHIDVTFFSACKKIIFWPL